MLFPRLLIACSSLVVTLVVCAPAHAATPTERLRDFFGKVNVVLADPATADQPLERVARVRRLVTEITDMNAASATALGAEWSKRTAGERDEFITLFADLLERAYVGRLAGAVRVTGSVTMTYFEETVTGDDAIVRTALRGLGGRDMRVDYAMIARGGRWRIRDIALDGVSTVENYHAQFRRLLRQDSYAALVKGLRAKLAEESLMFTALERKPAAPAVKIVESDLTVPPMDETGASPRLVEARPLAAVAAERPATRVASRPQPPVVVTPIVRPAPVVATAIASVPAPVAAPVVVPVTLPREPVESSAGEAVLAAMLLGVVATGGAAFLRRRSHR